MPAEQRSRSETMAYAVAGMEPPPVVPLRKSDPTQAGPYRLLSVLGSGGMGRVYLGRSTTGGPGPAAVKVIRPEYAEDPLFRKRFDREVGALGRVQGAHIVRLMGSGCDEDLVWVATEYVPGPTLEDVVAARGPVGAAAAWRLLADVGRAIEAIWEAGMVHRDLKPSNVILGADGARVIDFGVVQGAGTTSITVTGQNVGTPAFMSPEQVRGQEVTAASDVFSLASTLTYAVAGEPPFGEGTGVDVLHRVAFDPPSEEALDRVAAVDAELASFIRRCLDKDPDRRPLPEVLFRTAIGHQLSVPAPAPAPASVPGPAGGPPRPGATPAPVLPSDPAPHAPAPAPARRRRAVVAAVATVAVLAAGGVTVALRSLDGTPTPSGAPVPKMSRAEVGEPTSMPNTLRPTLPSATTAPKPSGALDGRNPATLDLRSAACAGRVTAGARGDCVKALQLLLDGYGLNVTADGRFGADTLAAVRVFQAEAGTVADGKVDTETERLLYGTARGPVRSGSLTVTESVGATSGARCLDSRAGTVQVWGCNGTAAQKWALYRVPGRSSQYVVVNQESHACLDADAATVDRNGQKIRTADCAGVDAQRWRLGTSTSSGGRTVVSAPDGLCLDADASTSGRDGQGVQGWGCSGSVNQLWNWGS
ncbi:protein kinase [Streptomyces sp. NPDC005423]|uniref:protein kinase domain-containing protein n=1 Tax=Streptomyces sp. NPDC005423 TaxID=3155343 RepID=UPI0033AD0BAF